MRVGLAYIARSGGQAHLADLPEQAPDPWFGRVAGTEAAPVVRRAAGRLIRVFQPPYLPPADRQFGDDAVQRAQFLLGDLAALEEVTDVAHHARTFRQIAQEAARIELIDQVGEEVLQF